MILSLVIFAGVLLITYWWADAGAFSAFMHLLCVIFAGIVAFALWEPLAYLLLPTGFGNYAMGTTLLTLFLVLLLVFRMATDRMIRAKLAFPRAADVTVGAGFGLASGALTMGIFAIGAGFIQSSVTIGDFSGWTRRSDEPKAPTIGSDRAPILHLIGITERSFAYLSWGAFSPWFGGGTFGTHQPELTKSAASLYRDSEGEGLSRVSLAPSTVSGLSLLELPSAPLSLAQGARPEPAYAVTFKVGQEAYDGNGQQFVLSASQARLLGDGRGATAAVARPMAWAQASREGTPSLYFFNSPSNYATSVAGQGDATFTLLFAKADLRNQNPRYVEIKGVRFPIKAGGSAADITSLASGKSNVKMDEGTTNIDSLVDFPESRYSIKGVTISSNDQGDLKLDANNYIIGGEQRFPKGGDRNVASELRVRGFLSGEDQRLLRLDAHAAQDGVRIFPDINPYAGTVQDAKVALLDEKGARYYAIGLVEDDGQFVLVRSMGGRPLTLKDIPIQPLGTAKQLALYFRVPPGVKLTGLALCTPGEDRVVNTLSLVVPKLQ
ncbi:MAG: hypothetical protein U0625_10150 [Phycisphaerales bacterium]